MPAMNLTEYAKHDALGLAAIVASKAVSPMELAETAAAAIAKMNPQVNAVVETYADRIDSLDAGALGGGSLRGVPFLIKDVFGHEKGRKIEFGSRLCKGMIAQSDTWYVNLLRKAGVNIIGRSAAPEYSMSGSTETALYGNTSTPWKKGYSAGGSSGGAMSAVMAGMVPIAHGSDIGGSIRIPASYCGGVGLKPSRGRVSFGPMVDENGYGLAQNFIQAKSVRDAATMLDLLGVPMPGDPFIIPKPDRPYAELVKTDAPKLKIGWSTAPLMGIETDREVAEAIKKTATALAEMGHEVTEADPSFPGADGMFAMTNVWFFGFDLRLEGYCERSGHKIGPDTLEPVTYLIYEHAKRMTAADFLGAMAMLNTLRRQLGAFYTSHDIMLTPTTPKTAEPWGNYNLGRTDVTMETIVSTVFAGTCQYTLPHNIMGTPAISLPLAMDSDGLPVGVQIAGRPAAEHLVLQLAADLEKALPWADRVPPLHVSRA